MRDYKEEGIAMRTMREDEFGDGDEEIVFREMTARMGFFGTDADVVAFGARLLQSPESPATQLPTDTGPLPYLSSLAGRQITLTDLFGDN